MKRKNFNLKINIHLKIDLSDKENREDGINIEFSRILIYLKKEKN